MPPTPSEVDQFLNDKAEDAYDQLVDRLVSSPRFGENMAVSWLDAARYADTNGYSIDGGRNQWLWRDWVIHSFNRNQPYDAFLVEQLAGDLLPDATDQQIIATGFNRNHAITHEGGTIPAENLTNYVADRVKTASETFLGLTYACAQCHDHKYDPISQRDYFRFFAFFNTLSDKGLDGNAGYNARSTHKAISCLASDEEAEKVRQQIAQAEAEYAKSIPEAQLRWEAGQLANLKTTGQGLSLKALEIQSATSPNGSPDRINILPDQSVTISRGDFAAYNVLGKLPTGDDVGPINGIRIVFSGTEGSKNRLGFGKMKGLEGNFVLSSVTSSVSTFPAGNVDLNAILPVSRLSATSQHPDFPHRDALITDPLVGWAPSSGDGAPQHITLTFAEPIDSNENPFITMEILFNKGGQTSPARFQFFAFSGRDDGSPHPADITRMLVADAASRTSEEATRMKEYFHEIASQKAAARYRLTALRERLPMLTEAHSALVMDTAKKPRKTHILNRGVYSDPLDEVQPGTPAVLPPLSKAPSFDPKTGSFAGRPANRLDLARWMVRDDHPLTSRIAVNRLWEHFFGRGLTVSTADFGSQGVWPSHPELLDWLAVDFRENGWNRNRMIKMIVSSRTYRQTSDTAADLMVKDQQNELLARGPRFRLSAEQIRDQALFVSGLLVERLGGPSVKPYQPGDLWRLVSHYGSSPATSQTFVQDHGEKLYRRSLYTYWKRTLPPTSLSTFDAPNREVCSIGRIATNTPLQALVTLNDPQFVEAARSFAVELLDGSYLDDHSRLIAGFRKVTSRNPVNEELGILEATLARSRKEFSGDPSNAGSLLAIGKSSRSEAETDIEQAAWTQLAATLLNLSETLTRR